MQASAVACLALVHVVGAVQAYIQSSGLAAAMLLNSDVAGPGDESVRQQDLG